MADIVIIQMTRDSVNMGDDVMAPHTQEIPFEAQDTLYELLSRASAYVPAMRDYEWEVMCGSEVLGTLVSGSDKAYRSTLKRQNIKVSALPEREIFCRIKPKKEPLSYFDRLEVLFDGDYFSLTLFRDYGDEKTILEKGATKITTMDKEFALKHGFRHRELGNYDKVLPLDLFEGLRIVRVPNDLNKKTEYVFVPKDKVREELEARAGITPQVLTNEPEVMNFCPTCGKKNNGGKYCLDCGTSLVKNQK